jgi:hypothetical protein
MASFNYEVLFAAELSDIKRLCVPVHFVFPELSNCVPFSFD